MVDVSQHIVPNNTDFCFLDCKTAFELLTDQEKLYSYYISQASWYGGQIVLYQTSPEAPGIYLLLLKLLRSQSVEELKKVAVEAGLSDEEYLAFQTYCAAFFSNSGNYKSFGDSKIVPNLSQEKLDSLLRASAAWSDDFESLWGRVRGGMYSLSAREAQLGMGPDCTTTYFSKNCTLDDAKFIKEFLQAKDIPVWNTRCMKEVDGTLTVRLASAQTTSDDLDYLGSHEFEGKKVNVVRGDYFCLMQLVADNLLKAKEFAANDTQRSMLDRYAASFLTGRNADHVEGSRFWIHDKAPTVESYIGFIETYRDPVGARGEFEGFVAMVNKKQSAKFGQLVSSAEKLLPRLPWPAEFEKDKFLQPDFTSLDVLTFSGGGIPAGINIPNYDEIRQRDGFKNVSLGNVLSSSYKNDNIQNITFLSQQDKELIKKYKAPSFEVQVGLHELLGHGSGKLFTKGADGKLNYPADLLNPLTKEPISSQYSPGETFYSKFPIVCSSYEECRAECVGLVLCLERDIVSIFGYSGEEAEDIIYVNWLNMVRAGLLALEYYSPETDTHRQAHMQARYVILRVLMLAGLVTIRATEDGSDLLLTLDRSRIDTDGRQAIADFLLKLQVYKSTGDYPAARDLYSSLSKVEDESEVKMMSWRQIVLARRVPRKMIVQGNVSLTAEGKVQLTEYEASAAGFMTSVKERFPKNMDDALEALWKADLHYWQ